MRFGIKCEPLCNKVWNPPASRITGGPHWSQMCCSLIGQCHFYRNLRLLELCQQPIKMNLGTFLYFFIGARLYVYFLAQSQPWPRSPVYRNIHLITCEAYRDMLVGVITGHVVIRWRAGVAALGAGQGSMRFNNMAPLVAMYTRPNCVWIHQSRTGCTVPHTPAYLASPFAATVSVGSF